MLHAFSSQLGPNGNKSKSRLTDGLEALDGIRNAEEVLPVDHAGAGVRIPSCLLHGGEVRGAVDQPEALSFTQQHHA